MKKRILGVFLATIFSVSLLGGCQIGDKTIVVSQEMGDKDVFQLNHEVVGLDQAYVFLSEYRNTYGTIYGVDLWEGDMNGTELESYVKSLALSNMAKAYTIALLAEDQHVTLTDEETKNVQNMADLYYDSLDKNQAKELGITNNTVLAVCTHYALAQKMFQSITGGIDSEISDDEARVMEVQQIFVTSEDTAKEIAAQLDIDGGSNFATLASTYNELQDCDKTITRSDIDPAAEEAVYSLENGQVTPMITGQDGYYFYKCINYYDETKTEANKLKMANEKLQEPFQEVYDQYLKTVESSVNMDAWRNVHVKDCTVVTDQSIFKLYDDFFHKK